MTIDSSRDDADLRTTTQKWIDKLYQQTKRLQFRDYGPLRRRFQSATGRVKVEGLFPSYVHGAQFLFQGLLHRWPWRRLRYAIRVLDDSMFATAITVRSLLEAEQLGAITVDTALVRDASDALLTFRDRNASPCEPAFCFYRQHPTPMGWVQRPENLAAVIKLSVPILSRLYRLALALGVPEERLPWLRSPDLKSMIQEADPGAFLGRFSMPADADDTGLALQVRSALLCSSAWHGEAAQRFAQATDGLASLTERLWSYAYRPLSDDRTRNLIDPRTYYWLRHRIARNDDPEPAFVTTWMQHPYEGRDFGDKASKLPLNMNNVEGVVNANILLGLAQATWGEGSVVRLRTREYVATIYADGLDLLTYIVDKGIVEHEPDVCILYYPLPTQFFATAAQHLRWARMARGRGIVLPDRVVAGVEGLETALRGPGTQALLAHATVDAFGRASWPGALVSNDDHLYASAVSLNALIDTWTVPRRQDVGARGHWSLHWHPDTPHNVHEIVPSGIDAIVAGLAEAASQRNACFSGSVKGIGTLPFFFPTNVEEQLGNVVIYGVRGVPDEDEYERKLEVCRAVAERRFGAALGTRGPSYSYWGSPAVSKATVLLSLAKYLAIN